jgi:uncharacterized protein (TIGR01319 family)
MASPALLIDFGSTFTKLVAVELDSAQVLGRSQAPSTVDTDVREGLLRALIKLHERHALFDRCPEDLSVLDSRTVLASSSAAGGLRIAVIGNVPGLTVEAANQAALGAGAKIVGSTAFKISQEDILKLESARPDMVLLTGGIDGGDTATILHNARVIAQSKLSLPIVVAGNRTAADSVAAILKRTGKEVRLVDNVMPSAGTLAVEPAREEIRKLFMERITHAKGLDHLQGIVPVVLPTPMAVLEGVRLGAQGLSFVSANETETGWGDMVVVDVGGATTDVHSIGYGQLSGEKFIDRGLAEPFAKRTVEGDLGIRFNAGTLLQRIGAEKFIGEFTQAFPMHKVSPPEISEYIEGISRETERIPQTEWQGAVDAHLARVAVDLALERHVGKKERVVTREGEAWVRYGKDLSETRTVIGTGGVFIHNPRARYMLSPSPDSMDDRVLRPKNPNLFVDASYLLYAVGLLSQSRPDAALQIFKTYMTPVN